MYSLLISKETTCTITSTSMWGWARSGKLHCVRHLSPMPSYTAVSAGSSGKLRRWGLSTHSKGREMTNGRVWMHVLLSADALVMRPGDDADARCRNYCGGREEDLERESGAEGCFWGPGGRDYCTCSLVKGQRTWQFLWHHCLRHPLSASSR